MVCTRCLQAITDIGDMHHNWLGHKGVAWSQTTAKSSQKHIVANKSIFSHNTDCGESIEKNLK